ncbi:MAG TPA: hypothetical protein EYH12_04965 [Psychromonas hadalis]|nr:hypothetical protein [Psychromonas hadalis]
MEIQIEAFAEKTILKKYAQATPQNSNEKLQIKISPVHPRHDIRQCRSPLKAKIVGEKLKSNTSIQVSYHDKEKWSLYVRARVKTLLPFVVPSK